ncbi:nuclear transport factor 2 family protein [Shewanella avicenniae]|uniref:Nuclear transport factor 2 family protein n=1 Tax=Shewanella avicenniae TaxID=2814294 RepID=A0ABX7QV70_9GAMM|nr:nuclear transport factor 2 family protein [Shewanella avicenniae]QSX34815.1 nuclear transport factor 2 family protein [Shewanella avicenniae]
MSRFYALPLSIIAVLLLLLSAMPLFAAETGNEVDPAADAVLVKLHQSAATADWDSYFGLFAAEASFVGTDMTEHWHMQEFEQYARATQGWRYTRVNQTLTQVGDVVVFDEILDHDKYGISRGTGTLIRTADGWKILQYHLSFPIPNKVALRITEQIKFFRKQQKASTAVSQ